MERKLSRREFLQVGAVAVSALGLQAFRPGLPPEDQIPPFGIGRVTIQNIRVYQEPSFRSEPLRWLRRDQLVDLIEQISSSHGPQNNPRWYRVVGGYAHSAYLQRVDAAHLNPPLSQLPEEGQLAEVTVPFSQSLRFNSAFGWTPLYRLYFGSVHWISAIEAGPDGEPWYAIKDEKLNVVHYVPGTHLRPIQAEELSPISPHVAAEEKRIEISITKQQLTAFEGGKIVLRAPISSGVLLKAPSPNGIPTETPQGRFRVLLKMPSRHMGDGNLTSDLEAYELPGVPWVSFFHATGVGMHGTYWHDNFGSRMSHGCVNMRNEDAKWIYRWTSPITGPDEWFKPGRGTIVQVF